MTDRRLVAAWLTALTLAAATALAARPVEAQRPHPRADSAAAPTATERQLFRLEDEWAQAAVRRDAVAIGRLVDRRWVYTDESGRMNREQGIAAFTTGPDTVTSAGNENMHATVFGTTAVVTGALWMLGHNAQGEFEHRYRYTDVWLKAGGQWKCIASQDYLLPAGTRQ